MLPREDIWSEGINKGSPLPILLLFLLHNTSNNNITTEIDPITTANNKRANRTSYMVTPKLPDSEEAPTSPKAKPSTFLSFFTRRGGKSRPLANLNTAPVDLPPEPSPKSPTFRNPFSPNSSSPLKATPLPPASTAPLEIPALYIAYPQAIRAAILAATAVSPEVILRRNSDAQVVKDAGTKPPRKGMLHRPSHSVKGESEWTRKLFVLIPGSLLQFSADGAVDRLPEKVLQLTAHSVAFASDALPGRPYVLQVSQVSDSGGILVPPAEKKHSIFSKLTSSSSSKPPSSMSKYTTSALLLVFEGAREMDQWMSSIRTEAAKLAGTWVPTETDEEDELLNGAIRRHTMRKYQIRPPPEQYTSTSVSGSSTSKRASRITHTSRRSIDTGITSSSEQLGTSYEFTGLGRNKSRSKINGSTSSNTPDRSSSSEETLHDAAVAARRQSMAALSASRSSMELRPPARPLSTISAGSRGSSDHRRREPATYSTSKRYSHHSTHSSTPVSTTMLSSSPNLHAPISTSSSTNGSTPPLPSEYDTFTRPPRIPTSNNNSTSSIPSSSATVPRLSKPLPNPASPPKQKRPRPASMFDKALPPPPGSRSPPQHYHTFRSVSTAGIPQIPLPTVPSGSALSAQQPGSKSPGRPTKNLQRRSMTALQVNLASGHFKRDPTGGFVPTPPAFPPPSCPLPKIPPLELEKKHSHIVVPKKSSPCLGFNKTPVAVDNDDEEGDDIVLGLGIFHEDDSRDRHGGEARRSRSIKERRQERKKREDARKSFNLVGRWRDTGVGGYGSDEEKGSDVSTGSTECVIGI
ncbi:hypothetical protein BJ508DRAFT_2686 [Ascobolus immersus RN42]|uniref:PH domain-containing protein n=1 Tax=Ascobolus immersus RN42 TaxID=1160509 RepID=A0A3N4IV09_ASCIM|nr:hypothetical protein BJ508DRAFT_2686 [Ascobolus immersus RN42]